VATDQDTGDDSSTKSKALRLEAMIKKMPKADKERMVELNLGYPFGEGE
jgi:predicted GIY-YIG superfamily endonuclease